MRIAKNYRPICLLPILYKLFSRVVRQRVQHILDAAQSPDQAGFRSGFSCDDHLLTLALVLEKLVEYQLPLWACTVDFRQAFDSVEFHSIWQALLNQGVPAGYVSVLEHL